DSNVEDEEADRLSTGDRLARRRAVDEHRPQRLGPGNASGLWRYQHGLRVVGLFRRKSPGAGLFLILEWLPRTAAPLRARPTRRCPSVRTTEAPSGCSRPLRL